MKSSSQTMLHKPSTSKLNIVTTYYPGGCPSHPEKTHQFNHMAKAGKDSIMFEINSVYFNGNEVSDYGIENGFVDYDTLRKSFDCILANGIIEATSGIGFWEPISGFSDNFDNEIFQYYIVSEAGAGLLKDCDELVFYNEDLGLYIWGVTFYGVAWSQVLTNIKINSAPKS